MGDTRHISERRVPESAIVMLLGRVVSSRLSRHQVSRHRGLCCHAVSVRPSVRRTLCVGGIMCQQRFLNRHDALNQRVGVNFDEMTVVPGLERYKFHRLYCLKN